MRRVFFFATILLLTAVSQAEVITVDDDGLADFNSIQLAIDSANNGDVIIVQSGFYKENINFMGKNIALTSTNPTDPNTVVATIINRAGDGPSYAPAVLFSGTEEPNCTLTGFKIYGYICGVDSLVDPTEENHTHATISHCILNGIRDHYEVIVLCDGTISNCVITDNYHGHDLIRQPGVYGCHGLIKNCTIAHNHLNGLTVLDGGTTIMQNSIIYNNGFSGSNAAIIVKSGGTLNISYSNIHGGLNEIQNSGTIDWGPGNIDVDPCFVQGGDWIEILEGDYHLQSAAGRWDPNQSQWVTDANTSLCIDAGNPGCTLGSEFNDANNVRINMGAYGGTPTASKSPANWRSIADLTNDNAVNNTDFAAFADFWFDSGQCIPADMDRNGIADFNDLTILTDEWLWP